MAAILQFDSQLKKQRKHGGPVAGGAEIVIFHGVRFERLEDASDSPAPPAGDAGENSSTLRRKVRK